jgi:hypothetical protein
MPTALFKAIQILNGVSLLLFPKYAFISWSCFWFNRMCSYATLTQLLSHTRSCSRR